MSSHWNFLGERETVARAAQRILRSFCDWGVLRDSEKGVYEAAKKMRILDSSLAAWMIEATLIASGSGSGPLHTLAEAPSLFPFALDAIDSRSLDEHPRLEIHRQIADELVIFKRTKRPAYRVGDRK